MDVARAYQALLSIQIAYKYETCISIILILIQMLIGFVFMRSGIQPSHNSELDIYTPEHYVNAVYMCEDRILNTLII